MGCILATAILCLIISETEQVNEQNITMILVGYGQYIHAHGSSNHFGEFNNLCGVSTDPQHYMSILKTAIVQ